MLLSSAISVLLERLLAVYDTITVLFVSLFFKHIVCVRVACVCGVCVCVECVYMCIFGGRKI